MPTGFTMIRLGVHFPFGWSPVLPNSEKGFQCVELIQLNLVVCGLGHEYGCRDMIVLTNVSVSLSVFSEVVWVSSVVLSTEQSKWICLLKKSRYGRMKQVIPKRLFLQEWRKRKTIFGFVGSSGSSLPCRIEEQGCPTRDRRKPRSYNREPDVPTERTLTTLTKDN